MKIRFTSSVGIADYELDTALGIEWAPEFVRTFHAHTFQRSAWNHHIGWPADHYNRDEHWTRLKSVANVLGVATEESISQPLLNKMHRRFVDEARTQLGNMKPLWHELNTGIHFLEHLLQGRGPATSLDFNGLVGSRKVGPLARAEAVRNGGLYALYDRIGRSWDEVWRARDTAIPLSHHVQQTTWNASCMMSFHDLPEQTDIEEAVWAARPVWAVAKEHRQRGLFRYGYLVSQLPDGWETGTIQEVEII